MLFPPGEHGPAISRFFSANYNLALFAQNPSPIAEFSEHLVVTDLQKANVAI